jgi:chemotaxis protein CheY-P-specific phosphatase CheC
MDQTKRIDKVLKAAETRVQDEVEALLGTDFTLIGEGCRFLAKAEVFSELRGKQVCALLDMVGDVSGKGCLLVGVKDAIRLGGTLIMLPDSELEESCGREDYTNEIADSYGEIANIIAGSLTKEFEESYPKACRFIRKEQDVIAPTKVDIESDQPVKNETYYVFAGSMTLEGRSLGRLWMLLPAAGFGLDIPGQEVTAEDAAPPRTPQANEPGNNVQAGVEPVKDPGRSDQRVPAPVVSEPVSAAQSGPATAADTPKKKVNAAKHKERIDRLLDQCRENVANEIGALLGVAVELPTIENRILDKEEFFDNTLAGKQVLARMEVIGDREDNSHFFVSLRDAIHLGGILIMLPPSELENVVQEEDFGDDTSDAYAEVANIISGVYTAVFEEQYGEKLRFIRKDLQQVVPAKVDPASDEPIKNRYYYCSSMNLVIDQEQLGDMHMLFPLEMLQLESLVADREPAGVAAAEGTGEQQNDVPGKPPQQTSGAPIRHPAVGVSKQDTEKERGRIDNLLSLCRERMQDELGALLGTDVSFSESRNSLLTKEEFFYDTVSGKQVMADMDVVGELEGKSFLSFNLGDAIRVGGILKMLPAGALERAVSDEDFGEETKDAFGEVANILSGIYTALFAEQYHKQIRFIITDLARVAPMKVEIESPEPIADEKYYVSQMILGLNGVEYGKVHFLVPAALFGLEDIDIAPEMVSHTTAASQSQDGSCRWSPAGDSPLFSQNGKATQPDILIISDDHGEGNKISTVLVSMGYAVKLLSFKDNALNYIPGQLKAVFLVMREVNEQAFGIAIKLNTASNLPLIAAGPGWTRTKVIKAVRYGVCDILLTPATADDIQEKASRNLLQMAA